MALSLGAGHFDRVEIRAVGWEIKKFSAPCLNGLSDSCHHMRGEVVTDYTKAFLIEI